MDAQRGVALIRSRGGFTLVELMIVIVVLAILVSVALPTFQDVMSSRRLSAAAQELTGSFNIARSEAMKRNVDVTVCASANGTSCASSGGWEQGWIVVHPTISGTPLYVAAKRPDGLSIIATGAGGSVLRFSFVATGLGLKPDGIAPVTIKVCRSSPSAGREERVIVLSLLGRATTSTTRTGACP